jgi:hypothetical protein
MATDEQAINWQLAQVLYDHGTKEFRLQVPLREARAQAWIEHMGPIANRPPAKPLAGDEDRDAEPRWGAVSPGQKGIVVEGIRAPHVETLQKHLERAVVEADKALADDQALEAERKREASQLTIRFQQR